MDSGRIPSLVAFKGTNNKYLGYVKNGECPGHLKFCYDQMTSPFVRHEVVEAGDGCAHIKCCYNNRYWRKRNDLGWIVAAEDSPNADPSSDSCTLFELIKLHEAAVSLRSLQGPRGVFAVYNETGHLMVGGEKGSFTLHDVADVVKLPKYVAFKGSDGLFLSSDKGSETELSFGFSDVGDDLIRHQVEETGDGNVRIKHLHNDMYWNDFSIPPFINLVTALLGPSGPAQSNTDVFRPIQIDAQTVALRSIYSSNICQRAGKDHKYLTADAPSLNADTHLTVVETVVRRRVHSVVYDMDSAKIYDLQPLALAKVTASNSTSESESVVVGVEYSQSNRKSWSNSNSLKGGVSASFEAGVPLIASAKIEVSVEDTFTWDWGAETDEKTTLSKTYTVQVDSGKSVEVNLQATKAKCDVKFSYIQEDVMSTGETIKSSCEDGVFQGMNYFDIHFTAKEVVPPFS